MHIGKRNERRLVGDAKSAARWVVNDRVYILHLVIGNGKHAECGVTVDAALPWEQTVHDTRLRARGCRFCVSTAVARNVPLPPDVPSPGWYAQAALFRMHYFDGQRALCGDVLYHRDHDWKRQRQTTAGIKCPLCLRNGADVLAAGAGDYGDLAIGTVRLTRELRLQALLQETRKADLRVPSRLLFDFVDSGGWQLWQAPDKARASAFQLIESFTVIRRTLLDTPVATGQTEKAQTILLMPWFFSAVMLVTGIRHHPNLVALRTGALYEPYLAPVGTALLQQIMEAHTIVGLPRTMPDLMLAVLIEVRDRMATNTGAAIFGLKVWHAAVTDALGEVLDRSAR